MADTEAGGEVGSGGAGPVGAALGAVNNLNVVVGEGVGGVYAGAFLLDPESARSIYRELTELAEEMRRDISEARRLCRAEPPAEDPASVAFTNAARTAWEAGAEQTYARWAFHQELADKVGKALDVYEEADEQAGRDARDAGGEGTHRGDF